jgi:hypothetical protein
MYKELPNLHSITSIFAIYTNKSIYTSYEMTIIIHRVCSSTSRDNATFVKHLVCTHSPFRAWILGELAVINLIQLRTHHSSLCI